MQGFGLNRSRKKVIFHSLFGITYTLALSACGVEGLGIPAEGGESDIGTIIPVQPTTGNNGFTAQELVNGSLLLDWPMDPQAVRYLVVIDGEVIAELSASTLNFVAVSRNGNLANSSIQVLSMSADNTLTPWVVNPIVFASTEITDPVPEENSLANGPDGVETSNPSEPANPIVVVEVDTDNAPTVDPAPVNPPSAALPEETVETETESPTVNEIATEEQVPNEEETPTGVATPSEIDPPPPLEELVNFSPVITDTSYHCDPVNEAVAFNVGDTDTFTLSVNDEMPQTLIYAADSSDLETVDVTVDANGVFTLSALKAGDSYLWLTAEDETGLVDEYEMWVVVE